MLTGWKLKLSKWFCIPQRYVTAIMSFFCIMVAFQLRVCLNIAITQMVVQKESEDLNNPDACPALDLDTTNSTSNQGIYYDWDEEMQGIILGAFYYGYAVTQLPSGFIIERYGAKHPLGVGVAITALMTLITPLVVSLGGNNPTGLIIVRVIEGLAEGPTMPALAALMARWVPKNERGFIASIIYGGAQIGNILGTVISGFVMSDNGNWSNVFYIFGGLGVIWYIFWQLLVYSDPRTHPFISDNEREFLESEIEEKSKSSIPWKPMLLSLSFWAIFIAMIGHDWCYYTMVTDLPKYMNDVLKFSIAKTGMLSALPYFVMWVTSFFYGGICDWCVRKNYLSIKTVRKIFTSIAAFGPGIFIIIASYAGCDRIIAVVMFCFAMGTMAAYNCGLKINILDLTPNFAGAAISLINGISAVTGIITPYLVGYLTPNQTQGEWRVAFWIMFAVLSLTNVFYVIFAEGDVQWWNDIKKNGYPQSWKKKRRSEHLKEFKNVEVY